MPKDKIMAEVHKIRDNYAKRFGNDLKAIYQDLKKQQEKNIAAGEKYASLAPKRPKQAA